MQDNFLSGLPTVRPPARTILYCLTFTCYLDPRDRHLWKDKKKIPTNFQIQMAHTLGYDIQAHDNININMKQRLSWETKSFSDSQEFPAFYGTRKFITAVTSAGQLSLS